MTSRGVIPPEVFLIDIDFKCFYRKTVEIMSMICYTHIRYGVWRSLVARTAGGREVAGSNPVAPIEPERLRQKFTLDKEQWTC